MAYKLKNNKKGFTAIELIIAIILTIPIIYSLVIVPADLYKEILKTEKYTEDIYELSLLKAHIIEDIESTILYEKDNTLFIGKNKYIFNDNSVIRNGEEVAKNKYTYSLSNQTLELKGANANLVFYVNEKFRGDRND